MTKQQPKRKPKHKKTSSATTCGERDAAPAQITRSREKLHARLSERFGQVTPQRAGKATSLHLVPDLGLFVPLPRADILALASHAARSTQSGADLLPRISLREPMKKIVIVETVNPVVEATPNRLKQYLLNFLLRCLLYPNVFHCVPNLSLPGVCLNSLSAFQAEHMEGMKPGL